MTSKKTSDATAQLYDALQEMLNGELRDLDDEAIQEVVEEVLSERREKRSQVPEPSSGWTGRINSNVVRPLFPTASNGPEAGSSVSAQVRIEADSEPAVEGVLHQVLEVGAILVQVEPRPKLNDLVIVTLGFPTHHLTIETQGRVVNISDRGTAIEVSGLGREDILALEAIRQEMEREEEEGPGGSSMTYEGIGGVQEGMMGAEKERSFSPSLTSQGRPGGVKVTHTGPHRKMVRSTTRRTVELPDPDIHVMRPGKIVDEGVTSAHEVYGPAPEFIEPIGGADRIEELASDRILDILLQMSANGFTGLVIVEKEEEQREQLRFDGGLVVERSTEPRRAEEELGPMLLAADRIDRRDLAMAAAHADELGINVARSLMELGILNPDELRHAIAGRLTFVLRELCRREQGDLKVYGVDALPAGFLPQPPLRVHVAVERIIYDRLCRRLQQLSATRREKSLSKVLDTYPEVMEEERERLERALHEESHIRLVERVVTGRKRMREVLTESALAPGETFAVLFGLHRMGLVRFDRSLHDTVVRERLRENITVKHLSVHKASYFEVLNVHWSSYSQVIAEAYERLCEQFDPERIPEELEEEVHAKVAEINERVEAAYAALAKRETRHAYRKRIMPEYKLEHAIPLFLKQAELARRRQQFHSARDSLKRVLEIEPDHGEAVAYLEAVEAQLAGKVVGNPGDTFD